MRAIEWPPFIKKLVAVSEAKPDDTERTFDEVLIENVLNPNGEPVTFRTSGRMSQEEEAFKASEERHQV